MSECSSVRQEQKKRYKINGGELKNSQKNKNNNTHIHTQKNICNRSVKWKYCTINGQLTKDNKTKNEIIRCIRI